MTPCPLCGEMIQPAAKKCPHCKEFLDSTLRAERDAEAKLLVSQAVTGPDLEAKVNQTFFTAIVGMLLLSFFGVLLGPVVMLFSRHYRKKFQEVGLAPPGRVGSVFNIGLVWLSLGIVSVGLFILAVSRR